VLSYRHAYHAGNAADVVKHVVLCALLGAITRKDTPFLYLETHGGAGGYELTEARALRNREFASGIGALWDANPGDAPAPVAHYLALVRRFNGGGALLRYPGSPWLATQFLREGDRAVIAELHPADFPVLAGRFRGDRRIRVLQQDGYALLRSELPPAQRRALVFIDPAYERSDEPVKLRAALADGLDRFGHGVFAIWYPVGGKHDATGIAAGLARVVRGHRAKAFDLRWDGPSADRRGAGITRCGLTVVNPPYGADAALVESARDVAARLDPESLVQGDWVVTEAAARAASKRRNQ
jgi:23S rRNA (adenine2030-N6)-methyltransferase